MNLDKLSLNGLYDRLHELLSYQRAYTPGTQQYEAVTGADHVVMAHKRVYAA